MASHLDDDDIFGGDFQGNSSARRAGTKRSFGDLDDDEDDIFGSRKANVEPKETAPGEVTKTILILRESLQNCKESLAACQSDLEAAKSEIQKWHTAFQNESFLPVGTTPEPKYVLNYLQTLRSSKESLNEQAKKKEAAFFVTFAKREQEIAELKSALRDLRAQLKPPSMQARKLLLDPAIHEEFTRLKNLVEEKDKKVKELQDNSDALKFSPNSKMGKMLMAKCRTLTEENEEIGNLASEGKIHELTMILSLQKSQYANLRNQLEGLHKHIDALTNNTEKSNEMLLVLLESLEEKDAEIQRLKDRLHYIGPQEDEQTQPATNETTNEVNFKENDNQNTLLKEVKVEGKVDE
uniref:FKBP12-interacting protein of 37 kDa n=1 Tax=Kalanchoe fedtschenkoi TaxID=63787 RepID=A0A7N0VFL3_KALFE